MRDPSRPRVSNLPTDSMSPSRACSVFPDCVPGVLLRASYALLLQNLTPEMECPGRDSGSAHPSGNFRWRKPHRQPLCAHQRVRGLVSEPSLTTDPERVFVRFSLFFRAPMAKLKRMPEKTDAPDTPSLETFRAELARLTKEEVELVEKS